MTCVVRGFQCQNFLKTFLANILSCNVAHAWKVISGKLKVSLSIDMHVQDICIPEMMINASK